MKRIGLIDVDGRKTFPNLSLMKLSAYHKGQGDSVEWYFPFGERYDRVYVSKVFSFTPDYDEVINADEVIKGGSGYDIELKEGREIFHIERNKSLPYEIEHIFPDYSIYPNLTKGKAYGFLTRGCPRGCDFCIVGKKEGRKAIKVADLAEFWNGQKEIILLDPNILACAEWRDLLDQLAKSGSRVNFSQGLDIRLITPEKIEYLNRIKIREIHFAWDRYGDKAKILPQFDMFARLSNSAPDRRTVYVLTNYNSTHEQDLERIYILRDMGYLPYVMIYDKANAPKITRRLQRWCNCRWIFKSVPNFNNYK